MGMVSGQPRPGCQRALQVEQNSMAQAGHCTGWGVRSPSSGSWHTAWQADAGHQVRHGSSSTSGTGTRGAGQALTTGPRAQTQASHAYFISFYL